MIRQSLKLRSSAPHARRAPHRVRFEIVPLAGRTEHAASTGLHTSRSGLLVVARDGGRTGVGEATPLPGLSTEDVRDCACALAADPRDLDALPPAARFAVETALLDLRAQADGVPLHALLGATAPRPIVTQTVVSLGEEPAPAFARGARALKLKIGGDARRDAARIAAARELDPSLVLRVDANGAAVGPALASALALHRVDFCEDPGPLDALAGLPVPTALDLRPGSIEPALAAVARGLASVVVLKPTVLGGLVETIELARRARDLGARVVVSHALESPVGLAACAHLALAIGQGEIHGLGHHVGLASFRRADDDRPLPVPSWLGAHAIAPPVAPGLAA